MYIRLHVKYLLFCQILMELEFSRQTFEKSSKHQTSLKSVRWEPSSSVQTDRQIDMTKLIVAFRNFTNARDCASEVVTTWSAIELSDVITHDTKFFNPEQSPTRDSACCFHSSESCSWCRSTNAVSRWWLACKASQAATLASRKYSTWIFVRIRISWVS